VTSEGSAGGRFQRAIERRHLPNATEAARELDWLSLDRALAYCALVAEVEPERYERAAIRWHGRFELEARSLSLRDAEIALGLLALLPNDPDGGRLLRRLLRRSGTTPWSGAQK
jgi:hypothetical protein